MTGRTVLELAASTRLRPDFLEQLLQDEQRRGNVERHGDHWSLTPKFDRQFGRTLADIYSPREET